jgi:signal transduction histidine kinase
MRTEQIRSEISRNLHDEVGATLTNISLSSLLAQKQLPAESTISPILDRIYKDSQHVSENMREIVWSINPEIDTVGEALPKMLRYASEVFEARGIELKAEMSPEAEELKLSMWQRRDLYLIFKEAVNNLVKHSDATHVTISMQLSGKSLLMMIKDDGAGFSHTDQLLSNGLRNMRERAKRQRWQINIESAPGSGTTITLNAQIA